MYMYMCNCTCVCVCVYYSGNGCIEEVSVYSCCGGDHKAVD